MSAEVYVMSMLGNLDSIIESLNGSYALSRKNEISITRNGQPYVFEVDVLDTESDSADIYEGDETVGIGYYTYATSINLLKINGHDAPADLVEKFNTLFDEGSFSIDIEVESEPDYDDYYPEPEDEPYDGPWDYCALDP